MDRTKFKAAHFTAVLKDYFEYQYKDASEFLDEVDTFLQSNRKRVESDYTRESKELADDEEEEEELYSFVYEDDHYKYKVVFVRLFYNSNFVSAATMLEFFLKRICVWVEKTSGKEMKKFMNPKAKSKAKQLRGKATIEKFTLFLEYAGEVDLKSTRPTLDLLKKYNLMRNSIVHEFASTSLKPELKAFLTSKMAQLNLEDPTGKGAFFINDKQFIVDYLETSKQYLMEILASLAKKK